MEMLISICAWVSFVITVIDFIGILFGEKPPGERFFITLLNLPYLIFSGWYCLIR